jgi:hypothetical protein
VFWRGGAEMAAEGPLDQVLGRGSRYVRYRTDGSAAIKLSKDWKLVGWALQNILLIQNDRTNANAVREALINSRDASFRVVWVKHCANGLRVLAQKKAQASHDVNRIAAILVDLVLPDSSGIETF